MKKVITIIIEEDLGKSLVEWDIKDFIDGCEVMVILYAMANKMNLELREQNKINVKERE